VDFFWQKVGKVDKRGTQQLCVLPDSCVHSPQKRKEFLMRIQQRVQQVWATFSARRRRKLRALARHSTDGRLRCRLLILVNLLKNHSVALIAQILHCARSLVYNVAHQFIADQEVGLVDRRVDNGNHKASSSHDLVLVVLVAYSPRDFGRRRPTWTQELLVLVLRQITGLRISRATMCRWLKRLAIRRKRPKPFVACPWRRQRRRRRLRQLQEVIAKAGADEVVVYADEVDIDLNPKIGPDYMLRGQQKWVQTPGVNEKRYLAGALDFRGGRLTYSEWMNKSSDLFIGLLHALARAYPAARKIHVILDNYKIHKSQRTQLALAALQGRIELHFLPPYCPDENRIERLWRDLHDNVTRNHTCRTMAELMREVRHYLRRKSRLLAKAYKLQINSAA
jgi:transposase